MAVGERESFLNLKLKLVDFTRILNGYIYWGGKY